MLKSTKKFQTNVITTLWWCLVNGIKINRSGDRSDIVAGRRLQFLALSSLTVCSTPDPFINLFKLNCYEQTVKKSG